MPRSACVGHDAGGCRCPLLSHEVPDPFVNVYGVGLMLCKGSVSAPIFAGLWSSHVHILCLGLKTGLAGGWWQVGDIRGTSPP